MRGLLYSTECETRKEYHLTGGPPPSGDRNRHPRSSQPGNWRLETAQIRRASSAPALHNSPLLHFSAGDQPHASRLSDQLGENFGPGITAAEPVSVESPCGERSEHRALGCWDWKHSLGVILVKLLQSLFKSRGHRSEDAGPEGPCGSAEHLPGHHH